MRAPSRVRTVMYGREEGGVGMNDESHRGSIQGSEPGPNIIPMISYLPLLCFLHIPSRHPKIQPSDRHLENPRPPSIPRFLPLPHLGECECSELDGDADFCWESTLAAPLAFR